ncbi:MAG: N-acetylmuramoyl-L-alanine amidase [Prevotella sp.]|nr:N-acetylmuramoyl-L-alanine amidase [Bacteroides sp.]MCM1366123.1 N-acetylmuramoyl-L-alanine amidase [Prevotella sp.]MCM1436812.1 N-acetylmuramoyl-L-alanine amidase [Prevotella sp.]
MRKINEIIVHCSATAENVPFHAADIDRWHRKRGFKSIGYHFVINLDGKVEKGRDLNSIGAHCSGRNSNSIGICYIGGLASDGRTPKDTRTPAQRKALILLLKSLIGRFPGARIRGHRDFAAKACPCFDATSEFRHIAA